LQVPPLGQLPIGNSVTTGEALTVGDSSNGVNVRTKVKTATDSRLMRASILFPPIVYTFIITLSRVLVDTLLTII